MKTSKLFREAACLLLWPGERTEGLPRHTYLCNAIIQVQREEGIGHAVAEPWVMHQVKEARAAYAEEAAKQHEYLSEHQREEFKYSYKYGSTLPFPPGTTRKEEQEEQEVRFMFAHFAALFFADMGD